MDVLCDKYANEFGHMYGIDDHYGDGTLTTGILQTIYPERGYSRERIYGEERFDASVEDNLTICNGCKMIEEANWDMYSCN